MTRKFFIKIIASLYMAQGLWVVGTFFLPIFTSQKPHSLNPVVILAGALGIWASIYLFQLSEFGRKYVIFLLSLRIAYNGFFIVWALFQNDFSFALNFFSKPIFEFKSVYPFVLTLFIWLIIALGTIIFLSQKQTKVIFMSERTNTASSKPPSESVSNQPG